MTIKSIFNKKNISNIALIILSIIIAYNIYKWQTKEIHLLQQKKEEATKKNELLEAISRFERKTSAYRNLLAKKDTGMVIDTLSKFAKETGVKIISIRPMPEARFQGYVKTPFDLVLSSPGFHALGRFISKIESYKEVYMVDSLDIKPVQSLVKTNEFTVTITVSSFAATN